MLRSLQLFLLLSCLSLFVKQIFSMIFYVNDKVNLAFLQTLYEKEVEEISRTMLSWWKAYQVGHQKLAKQFVLFTFCRRKKTKVNRRKGRWVFVQRLWENSFTLSEGMKRRFSALGRWKKQTNFLLYQTLIRAVFDCYFHQAVKFSTKKRKLVKKSKILCLRCVRGLMKS